MVSTPSMPENPYQPPKAEPMIAPDVDQHLRAIRRNTTIIAVGMVSLVVIVIGLVLMAILERPSPPQQQGGLPTTYQSSPL